MGSERLSDIISRLVPEQSERDAVEHILELLDLAPVAETYAGSLPTGLGRIAEVGRAICTDPKVLLLDEPTAGLDRPRDRSPGAGPGDCRGRPEYRRAPRRTRHRAGSTGL